MEINSKHDEITPLTTEEACRFVDEAMAGLTKDGTGESLVRNSRGMVFDLSPHDIARIIEAFAVFAIETRDGFLGTPE